MINFRLFFFISLVVTLSACATVNDVRRASDMIRLDNELARVLTSKDALDDRPMNLESIANEAIDQAEKVKDTENKLDAISFYRIAATAFWKSNSSEASGSLMATVNEGEQLCAQMAGNAPDRDCIFMKLILPFAGIESATSGRKYDEELGGLDFIDGSNPEEVALLDEAATYLHTIKKATEKVSEYGSEPALTTHTELRKYYCRNMRKVRKNYENTVAELLTQTKSFYTYSPGSFPKPVNDVAMIEKIKELSKKAPEVCQ